MLDIEIDLDNNGFEPLNPLGSWSPYNLSGYLTYGAETSSGSPFPTLTNMEGELTLDNSPGWWDPNEQFSPLAAYLNRRHAFRIILNAPYRRTLAEGLVERAVLEIRADAIQRPEVKMPLFDDTGLQISQPVTYTEITLDTDSCAEIARKLDERGIDYEETGVCSPALYQPYSVPAGTELARDLITDSLASRGVLMSRKDGSVIMGALGADAYTDAVDCRDLDVYLLNVEPNLTYQYRRVSAETTNYIASGQAPADPDKGTAAVRGTPVVYSNVMASMGDRLAFTTGDTIIQGGGSIPDEEAPRLTREVIRVGQTVLDICGRRPTDPAIAQKEQEIDVAQGQLQTGRVYSAEELSNIQEMETIRALRIVTFESQERRLTNLGFVRIETEDATDSFTGLFGSVIFDDLITYTYQIYSYQRPGDTLVTTLNNNDEARADAAIAYYQGIAGEPVDNTAVEASIAALRSELEALNAALEARVMSWQECLDAGGVEENEAPAITGASDPIVLRSRGDSATFYIGQAFPNTGSVTQAGVIGIDKAGALRDADDNGYPDIFDQSRGFPVTEWARTTDRPGGRSAPQLGVDYSMRVIPLRSANTIAVEVTDLTGLDRNPPPPLVFENEAWSGGRYDEVTQTVYLLKTAFPSAPSGSAVVTGFSTDGRNRYNITWPRRAASDTATEYAFIAGLLIEDRSYHWRYPLYFNGGNFIVFKSWEPGLYQLENTGTTITINTRENANAPDLRPRTITLSDRVSAQLTRETTEGLVSEAAYIISALLALQLPPQIVTFQCALRLWDSEAQHRLVDSLEPGVVITNLSDLQGLRVPSPILITQVRYQWDNMPATRITKTIKGILLHGELAESPIFRADESRVDSPARVG